MLEEKKLCALGSELSELSVFERLMRYGGSQQRLLQCFQVCIGRYCSKAPDSDPDSQYLHLIFFFIFQAVIEHGTKLPKELAVMYIKRCEAGEYNSNYLIDLGLRLG